MSRQPYNFAYLDEQTKRMIRRAILKAVAIPGYQVPFASREMPMPYGWGTGGVQVTAAILGPNDVLKVIDQGADDTTNAVSIRAFFAKTAGVATTTDTTAATIIQTRHRVPETPLSETQILVYQVPIPEPLRFLEPREPTALLDAVNRDAVVALIAQRRALGAGFLSIFHDEHLRERLADRVIDILPFSAQAAA
jgi:alpha-D-ribose 1-methylphosphonate 5-phosphate C-P lyase